MNLGAAMTGWWERKTVLCAILFAVALPLLLPAFAPLTDLPGHMARWHIAMEIGHSPSLARYFSYAWQPIGNLGLDLLVPPLAHLLGLELAAKLAVLLIPLLTAVGMLWSAFEVHRRIPPSAWLALPFAYAWPFQFGFVNFAFSQALAFCALGYWLRLGRNRRFALRAALFAPIGCALWVAHNAGWGLFCLMAFGAEIARLRKDRRSWLAAGTGAVLQCMPLGLPILFMLFNPNHSARGNSTGDWFDMSAKFLWLISSLRDRWHAFDLASVGLVAVMLYAGGRDRRLGFDPGLAWPALLCGLAFLLLPRLLLGGAYVDMRVVPAALALALLSIRTPEEPRLQSRIAVLALLFFALRIAGTTLSFADRSGEQQRQLQALDAIPRGAAVLALIAKPCLTPWSDGRFDHLPAFAILRRDAFVNEQWDLEGQQLVRVRHSAAAPFLGDPSQLVYPARCPEIGRSAERAIASFPRAAFTHVWTMGIPQSAVHVPDLRLIWSNGVSAVYAVARPTPAAAAESLAGASPPE